MSVPPNLVFQPVLGYLCRHGSTEANSDNCFRGWNDYPLDEEGHQAGEAIQNFFSYTHVGRVITSDLSRAVQTAQYIMDSGNVCLPYLSIEPALRPWDIGKFAGQKKTDAVLKRFQKYADNPDLKGEVEESLREFRNRNKIVMDLLAVPYNGYPNVIVAHTSNLTAAQHGAEENNETLKEEQSDIVAPGGVVAIYLVDNLLHFCPVLGEISESEPTGVS